MINSRKFEPVIHIGYPKTGTTWMKTAFFPKIKNINLLQNEILYKRIISVEDLLVDYENIKAEFNKFQGRIVICNHWFTGTNHNFGTRGYVVREQAIRLNKIFPDAKIILFIRKQTDIIASMYIQYLKLGGTYKISKFLQTYRFGKLNDVTLFSYKYFEYHQIIELYKSLFGNESVFVYLYEEFDENPEEFVANLSVQFNFEYSPSDINFNKVNVRYRKLLISLIRAKNLFTFKNVINKRYILHIPGFYEYSAKLFNCLNKWRIFGDFQNSEKILGKKLFHSISEYYKNPNQILIENHQLKNIKKYNYPLN